MKRIGILIALCAVMMAGSGCAPSVRDFKVDERVNPVGVYVVVSSWDESLAERALQQELAGFAEVQAVNVLAAKGYEVMGLNDVVDRRDVYWSFWPLRGVKKRAVAAAGLAKECETVLIVHYTVRGYPFDWASWVDLYDARDSEIYCKWVRVSDGLVLAKGSEVFEGYDGYFKWGIEKANIEMVSLRRQYVLNITASNFKSFQDLK